MVLAKAPDNPDGGIKVLDWRMRRPQTIAQEWAQVSRSLQITVEHLCIVRVRQAVRQSDCRPNLPTVLKIESELIVMRSLIKIEWSWKCWISDTHCETTKRKLQNVRECRRRSVRVFKCQR